jgi:hypothetical protein
LVDTGGGSNGYLGVDYLGRLCWNGNPVQML